MESRRRRGAGFALAGLSIAALAGAALSARAPETVRDGLIDTTAVAHDPDALDQILWATAENPALRFLFLRLATRADDVWQTGVRVYRIGDREYEAFKDYDLDPYAVTDNLEYRAITLPFNDEPTADELHTHWRGYRLWIDDGDQVSWLGRGNLSTKENDPWRFVELFRPRATVKMRYGTSDPADVGVSDRVITIPGWVQDAVFYQVELDRFRNGNPANDPAGALAWEASGDSAATYGGDLQGLIQALPHLDSLGVTALYLSPVLAVDASEKPETASHIVVDPRFGDEALLVKLLERAHRRGMKVVLEGEFDHVSSAHPYFQDAVHFGLASDFWHWFRFRDFPVVTAPPNYASWSGQAESPSWNLNDEDTRNYLLNIARRWIELGVDGWAVASPEAGPHEFWAMLREAVKAMDARAYVVGRIAGETGPWGMGDQFDAVPDDRFRKAAFDFLADGALDARGFNDILGRIRVERPDPLNRIAFNSLDGDRRLASLPDPERRLLVLFQMTGAGAPVIRAGDEIGLGSAASAGRATYAWDAGARDASLRDFYQRLLLLRRDHPALRRGSFTPVYAEGDIYAYVRRSSEEVLLVILNRSESEATFKLPLPRGGAAVKQKDAIDLLSGSRHGIRSSEIFVKQVPPLSGVILQLR